MNPDQIICDTITECEEYLEMCEGDEYAFLCRVISSKLHKQKEETEYYKRIANAATTKHA